MLTGVFAAMCTALLIAAITQKIELTSNERFHLRTLTDIRLRENAKTAAAQIIQAAWRR